MGDRVSIQFKDKDGTLSPVLFSHWGGMEFVKQARKYVKELKTELPKFACHLAVLRHKPSW